MEDLVQAQWTDNMPGTEFPTGFSGYITVCWTSTKNGFEQYYNKPIVNKGFWEHHLYTGYNSEEI